MGRIICLLFFCLLIGIFFNSFKEKPEVQVPPPEPPYPFTTREIRIMCERGVQVQFPSEIKSHLLSATTLPRDLLQAELLKLSGSSLYNVPPWLKRFTNLRYLDLSENNLDADNDLIETLQAMPKLDVLNLSNNPLFKSNSSQNVSLAPVWHVLNSLGELYLSDTQGTAKNYGSLAALRALQRLDLSNNQLGDDIVALELNKLHVLDILNLSHNGLTQFPGQYLPRSQLRALNISHNNLTNIPYFEMSQLEVLYLQGNGAVSMVDDYRDLFCLDNLRILLYDSGSKIPQELRGRVETVQEHSGTEDITVEVAVEYPKERQADSSIALQKKIQDAINRLQEQRISLNPKYSHAVEQQIDNKVQQQKIQGAINRLQQQRISLNPKYSQKKGIGHYIIHGNGTVIDTSTGLMWKHCSEGLSGVNCENGNADTYTWDDAIQRFRYGSSYAGYSDWRMPTVNELKTLIYCSNGTGANNTCGCKYRSRSPTINIQVFPNTPSSSYWSASPYTSGAAWGVYFYDGCAAGYACNDSFTVRLVRNTN